MHIFSEQNIARISFLSAIILVGVLVFSTGALFIAKKVTTLNKDLATLEHDFIEQQKEQLKADVTEQFARIDTRRAGIQETLEARLKSRVEEASAMAGNIYRSMQGRLTDREIATVIREAVRPIRFNEEQGYVFILTLAGEAILYPPDSGREGTNFLLEGAGGDSEAVADLIALAKEKNQGFSRYDWSKPADDSGRRFAKISYVSLFEPFGWVIGTGEYADNLDQLARTTITRELRDSFRTETNDYFFVYELHNLEGGADFATMLINSNRPDLEGEKISDDYTDSEGKQFRKEFLQGIRSDGEAYVVYWYDKPDDNGVGRKLAYFRLYPEWNWVVARGIYFDRLDAVIAAKKGELKKKVSNDILLLLEIFLAAVAVALALAYALSRGLQRVFDRYRRTQTEHLDKLGALNKALEKQSRTDALTGLYNRGFFNSQLILETSRANRYATPLSLVIFDVDQFKLVNDTLGHLAGDSVLKELAELIRDNIRQTDILARWGGEEFAILAPGVDIDHAFKFAETLRLLVAKHGFGIGRPITCSFGVSSYVLQEKDNVFLQRADEALYHAKQEGRNRSSVF